jgi:1-acyl-sn-glycerol-3-phosphate acyltransferase
MFGNLRLATRLLLTVIWVIFICFPLYFTWALRLQRANSKMMMFSFDGGCLIWGVRVRTQGTLSAARPLLVVSNHFSYLDVFALGSKIPARFTPKSEIAGWPIIGLVCKIGGCIFINRKASRTLHNKSELDYAMGKGNIISLFPEGTTSEGTGLLPFKSSFFSVAEHKEVSVQPVSVAYTSLNGLPIDATTRPLVGWYGDAEFFPHALNFLRQHYVDVLVTFHKPVEGTDFDSRKEIANYCKDVIERALF